MHPDPLDHWLHVHHVWEFPCYRCGTCRHVQQRPFAWCANCADTRAESHIVTQADAANELAEEAAQLSERRWSQR